MFGFLGVVVMTGAARMALVHPAAERAEPLVDN
jgi:hypothetical protein